MTSLKTIFIAIVMLVVSSIATAGVDLSGEYWFGSLSANANTRIPWGKQGKIVVNGNNWYQEWDDYNGHHSFSSTFTASVQSDGSVNIIILGEPNIYNVAWNGSVMIHADTAPDTENRLGVDIIARKAINVDFNDVIGNYTYFGHWLNWAERADSVGWGNLVVDANGTAFVTSVEDDGHHENGSYQWIFDDVNAVINVPGLPSFSLCENGLIGMSRPEPDADNDFGYNFFVRKTSQVITPDDIADTYLIRFLESAPGGQPFTCGNGTCIIRPDGTFSVDAYYTGGEHDVFDGTYTIGPGNTFHFIQHDVEDGDEIYEGIISPDLGLIFLPEYQYSNPPQRTEDDWIGGVFLVRIATNIADLNWDRHVDFSDYVIFAEQWLKSKSDLSANLNHDSQVDWLDLKIFADNWLWETQ